MLLAPSVSMHFQRRAWAVLHFVKHGVHPKRMQHCPRLSSAWPCSVASGFDHAAKLTGSCHAHAVAVAQCSMDSTSYHVTSSTLGQVVRHITPLFLTAPGIPPLLVPGFLLLLSLVGWTPVAGRSHSSECQLECSSHVLTTALKPHRVLLF